MSINAGQNAHDEKIELNGADIQEIKKEDGTLTREELIKKAREAKLTQAEIDGVEEAQVKEEKKLAQEIEEAEKAVPKEATVKEKAFIHFLGEKTHIPLKKNQKLLLGDMQRLTRLNKIMDERREQIQIVKQLRGGLLRKTANKMREGSLMASQASTGISKLKLSVKNNVHHLLTKDIFTGKNALAHRLHKIDLELENCRTVFGVENGSDKALFDTIHAHALGNRKVIGTESDWEKKYNEELDDKIATELSSASSGVNTKLNHKFKREANYLSGKGNLKSIHRGIFMRKMQEKHEVQLGVLDTTLDLQKNKMNIAHADLPWSERYALHRQKENFFNTHRVGIDTLDQAIVVQPNGEKGTESLTRIPFQIDDRGMMTFGGQTELFDVWKAMHGDKKKEAPATQKKKTEAAPAPAPKVAPVAPKVEAVPNSAPITAPEPLDAKVDTAPESKKELKDFLIDAGDVKEELPEATLQTMFDGLRSHAKAQTAMSISDQLKPHISFSDETLKSVSTLTPEEKSKKEIELFSTRKPGSKLALPLNSIKMNAKGEPVLLIKHSASNQLLALLILQDAKDGKQGLSPLFEKYFNELFGKRSQVLVGKNEHNDITPDPTAPDDAKKINPYTPGYIRELKNDNTGKTYVLTDKLLEDILADTNA